MSIDLKLDDNGDIVVESGGLALVSGKAERIQRIKIYLRTYLGEYFYDTTKGVSYQQEIFEKGTTDGRIKSIFASVINEISGVDLLKEIAVKNRDLENRNVEIDLYVVLEGAFVEINFVLNSSVVEYLPQSISDLSVWFDATTESSENQNGQGSFTFEGSSELKGFSDLDIKNRAFDLINSTYDNGNRLSFSGTPFISDFQSLTLCTVIHTKLQALQMSYKGFLHFDCIDHTTYDPISWNFWFYENGGASKLKLSRSTGGYIEILPSGFSGFVDKTFVLIFVFEGLNVKTFCNNIQIASTNFTADKLPFRSIGEGKIFDSDGTNVSGYLGEILFYQKSLSEDERTDLYNYLKEKWNLS